MFSYYFLNKSNPSEMLKLLFVTQYKGVLQINTSFIVLYTYSFLYPSFK